MSSDSAEKTAASKRFSFQTGAKPQDTEALPCPRCDSINTKFCYYNNYNLAQPRHFCKACRRYWTRGGTLRNVPVGGGTRKSSSVKRSRNGSTPVVSAPQEVVQEMAVMNPCELNLNQAVCVDDPMGGLNCEFGLGGGGLGFDVAPWEWSIGGEVGGEIDQSVCASTTSGGELVGPGGGCNTWQVEGGLGEGEYYCWSDLAMSTPGNGVK
ncbi:hypothetical protein DCAR_0522289 [Daucus carota subsp. sativus]|uniref:Dof zinc finger protein n=1 Tax=Daucus carota subsp. sativus TaxID=79200 RepID=A0A164ZQ99_DAUCS|nr:hypothetical protein DCAR_0522289 [Daucus carota subsp. sativus]